MSTRPNILYLVHRVPYPPNRGDRIRSFHLLNFLAEQANVYLATLAEEPLEPGTREALAERCQAVVIESLDRRRWLSGGINLLAGKSATEGLFVSTKLRQQIEAWTNKIQFDAVVVFCSSMVQYLRLPKLKNVPTVVDLVDVDSQKFFDYAAATRGPKRWLYQLEGRRLRALECSLPQRVRAITLVSEAEANIYRGFCPNKKTFAVKNGVDLTYFQPVSTEPQPHRCVFVGAFDYRPNIDGAVWFCQEVWPQVRAELPEATLALVGRNPDAAVRRLANIPGVEVIGSVPDVRPFVAASQLAVVPLRIARGIQNKVLEAFAMRKPVLASSQALEGLAVTPGVQIAQADTAEEWRTSIFELLANRKLREQLAQGGYNYVQQEHDWSNCLARFREILELTPRVSSSAVASPAAEWSSRGSSA